MQWARTLACPTNLVRVPFKTFSVSMLVDFVVGSLPSSKRLTFPTGVRVSLPQNPIFQTSNIVFWTNIEPILNQYWSNIG